MRAASHVRTPFTLRCACHAHPEHPCSPCHALPLQAGRRRGRQDFESSASVPAGGAGGAEGGEEDDVDLEEEFYTDDDDEGGRGGGGYRLGSADEQFCDFSGLALKPDHFNRWAALATSDGVRGATCFTATISIPMPFVCVPIAAVAGWVCAGRCGCAPTPASSWRPSARCTSKPTTSSSPSPSLFRAQSERLRSRAWGGAGGSSGVWGRRKAAT